FCEFPWKEFYNSHRLYRSLPSSAEAQVMGKQLLRCGTSVAANYRSACRARSRAEFAARLGIVVEEADESMLWLELLEDSGVIRHERLDSLQSEARDLTALFTASQHTTRGRG
ncbi:MAG: four helix bundle protein, partial [Terriglobales bacterium]